jgi:hypothetical protein
MPKKEGRHYRFEKYEFWAEGGMISLVDTELAADSHATEQSHHRIAAGEFMKRAIAAFMQEPDKYGDKLAKLRRLLDDAKEACKLAKAQGDPMDPSVIDHVVRHQRKRSIVMPNEIPGMAPSMKIRGKGRKPADTLRDGFQVVPDITIGGDSMLTPARAEAIRKARATRR